MSKSEHAKLPKWFTPENVETVIFVFPDVYGRLMGKRMTTDFFLSHGQHCGMHTCNYLMTVDVDMNILPGFKVASWDQGYGDFHVKPDLGTLRLLPWHKKTAIILGDMHDDTKNQPVEESPRQVLTRQIERLTAHSMKAYLGSELEFYLYNETFGELREKGYRNMANASDYSIDYHVLQPGCDEDVLARLRNEMTKAGIAVECSKGETGNGQHEVNLVYTEAMEMADRHVLYKSGAKDIANQQGKSITFMAKPTTKEAGSGCHIHTSIWDIESKQNVFWDAENKTKSRIFQQFLGGLLKYSRELTYFFAPTINSYKRYQPESWAPTAIVCSLDNRTCGYREIGSENSLRIENRMPGADANPYLAFAATIAAGLRGIEENLDGDCEYKGNAYADKSLPRLPATMRDALGLFGGSEMAKSAFGSDVVDYYRHLGHLELDAYNKAVTDWERYRYFEQF